MTFNSYVFLFVFLPSVITIYSLLRETRFVNWFLSGASLLFYSFAGPIYLVPLLFTCIFDYIIGRLIDPEQRNEYRKPLFILSLGVQLGLLATLKYAGWLAGVVNDVAPWLGLAVSLPALSLILPPGISFYTFHTISYTADIYRGTFKPHNSLIDYVTFVAFFPQLVAGPIARAANLLPQLAAKRPPITWQQAETATWLICWGLFKKITLADNFGQLTGLIGDRLVPGDVQGGMGLLFVYAFAGQIYCDFSAYTDIARGVAKLFNVELTRNFATPYFATSPSEFWRRWHISLSRFVKSYIYDPMVIRVLRKRAARGLPISSEGLARPVAFLTVFVWPTLLTMSLFGLWHGAGFSFVIWGLYHGVLLVLYRVLHIEENIFLFLGRRVGGVVANLVLFHLVCLGWIFFRAGDAQVIPALASIGALLSGRLMEPSFLHEFGYGILQYALPLLLTEPFAYRKNKEFVDLYEDWSWPIKAMAYILVFYGIVMFGAREQSEFIYFRF
ncbi:MAG TPA: MBOAT family O-acyltransferase [Blastocatellia bacterium]